MHAWTPRRDGEHPATVRMVDLTAVAAPADVPQEHTEWRDLMGSSTTPAARSVPRMDLLYGDTVLSPPPYLADGGLAGAERSRCGSTNGCAGSTRFVGAAVAPPGRGVGRLAGWCT